MFLGDLRYQRLRWRRLLPDEDKEDSDPADEPDLNLDLSSLLSKDIVDKES